MVSRSGELLVSKAVRVTTEVSDTSVTRCLIVEVIMTIHIEDDVVSALFHLTSRVRGTVDIEVLKEVITAVVDDVVLPRITERHILEMDIHASVLDLQSSRTVRCVAEIEDSRVLTAPCDSFITGDDDALGSRADEVVHIGSHQVVLPAEEVECVSRGLQFIDSRFESARVIEGSVTYSLRRGVIGRSEVTKRPSTKYQSDEKFFHIDLLFSNLSIL